MADSHDSQANRDARLQAEFAAAADGLSLPLETTDEQERCAIGIALIPIVPSTPIIHTGRVPEVSPYGKDDDVSIREIIKRWESVSAFDLLEAWRELATEPFVAVGDHWVTSLDLGIIKQGLESQQFAAQQIDYPPYEPRKVTVSKLKIVHIGHTKAVATYQVQEEYRNGKVFAGNSAAVLMKHPNLEWRITVFTKHNRYDDFVPVE